MPKSSIFMTVVLVLLSGLFSCSKDDQEEHAGSDSVLLEDTFQIVSVQPEDGSEKVPTKTSLTAQFNSEIDNETVFQGSITLVQNSSFIQGSLHVVVKSLHFQPDDNLIYSSSYTWPMVSGIRGKSGKMLTTTFRMSFQTQE